MKPRAKWKEISHDVEELDMLVKEKKSTWVKSCKENSRTKTEIYAREGMAEDAKVVKRALEQLRKDKEEERAARELLEEGTEKLEDRTTSARKSGR